MSPARFAVVRSSGSAVPRVASSTPCGPGRAIALPGADPVAALHRHLGQPQGFLYPTHCGGHARLARGSQQDAIAGGFGGLAAEPVAPGRHHAVGDGRDHLGGGQDARHP
ncbi:hypothetical protein, partial [Kitasatospora cheerisanensis]|uniref:hypothetical protein n=1 Tax=Kitasatospora cheerisanensis TaxID=81942 RepID=UPI00056C3D4E